MENKGFGYIQFEYIHILMQLYNIKTSDISNILGYDRSSIMKILQNRTELASEKMLKDLCDFFNVSLNLLMYNDDCYCIKIKNQSFKKNIYIDYKDYIFLKFKGIIVDEFVDKKQIVHNFKDKYLFLLDNSHIGRTFTNLAFLKEMETLDPNKMILILTESPNYTKESFKASIIKLLCLGYEEDLIEKEWSFVQDYKNGFALKEKNSKIKQISINLYNYILDYENNDLGKQILPRMKEMAKQCGPIFFLSRYNFYNLSKFLNDDDYKFLLDEYINNLVN